MPPSGLPLRAAIAVIGGGPSGYFAAITAAREASVADFASVVLLESTSRPLRKVLASGGGRCNIMHTPIATPRDLAYSHYPRGRREMIGPFTAFDQHMTREWFETEGVELKTESDGRVFPVTDNAATVANALQSAAVKQGVQVFTGYTVKVVEKMGGVINNCNTHSASGNARHRFEITVTSKQDPSSASILRCDALLLATGSAPAGFRIAKHLGLPVNPRYPSLFTFRLCDGHPLENLQGVSIPDVELTLLPLTPEENTKNNEPTKQDAIKRTNKSRAYQSGNTENDLTQRGPLLITHRGVSGPAALRLSAFAAQELNTRNYAGTLALNLIPDASGPDEVASALRQYATANGRKSLAALPLSMQRREDKQLPRLPRRLWKAVLTHCNLDPTAKWANLSNAHAVLLSKSLTCLTLPFRGKDTNKEEFVTAGGVKLENVNLKKMESKSIPGLFFAGEVLDVDGVTGGFNFQNCWSTGYIAGVAMADSVAKSS